MQKRRLWIALMLFSLAMINYIDRVTLSFAAAPIAKQFDLSPVALGYLFSSFRKYTRRSRCFAGEKSRNKPSSYVVAVRMRMSQKSRRDAGPPLRLAGKRYGSAASGSMNCGV